MDQIPRLLKSRSGHYAPPTKIRFYSDSNELILSGATDRSVRSFNMNRDEQNIELSQGAIAKKAKVADLHMEQLKLKPVIDIASCNFFYFFFSFS